MLATFVIRNEDQDVLLEVGWMWPAYVSNRVVWDLLGELRAARPSERKAIVERTFPAIYPPGSLATGFLGLYIVVPILQEFATSIEEAIEAAMMGRFTAAVATLTPVVEGILRRIGELDGREPGIKKTKLAQEFDHMIFFEQSRRYDSETTEERIAMVEGFKRYFLEVLYKDTRAGDQVDLNRHAISHALEQNWGKPANFYVLISIIDHLSFIMCMRTDGAPVLFPSETQASRELSLHYLKLRRTGLSRPPLTPSRPPLDLGRVTRLPPK